MSGSKIIPGEDELETAPLIAEQRAQQTQQTQNASNIWTWMKSPFTQPAAIPPADSAHSSSSDNTVTSPSSSAWSPLPPPTITNNNSNTTSTTHLLPPPATTPTTKRRNNNTTSRSSSYTSLSSLPLDASRTIQNDQADDDDIISTAFPSSHSETSGGTIFSTNVTPLLGPTGQEESGKNNKNAGLQVPLTSSGSSIASSIRSQRPPTPLPWLKTLTISSVLFCNSFNTTVLLPFIAFMVEDFGIAPSPEDVGKYSGFMLASYMTGQMIFSYPWGIAADVWGRKPSLLIGLLGSCICTTLFGFSPNFATALLLRFLCGSLNGIVSITKTTLSEITDQTNQGQAFGVLGVARAIGLVVGPAVGGMLSQVDEKYPGTFPEGSLFARYPYAIPCLIGGAISGIGFIASVFILEETKKWPTPSPSSETPPPPSSIFSPILRIFQKTPPSSSSSAPRPSTTSPRLEAQQSIPRISMDESDERTPLLSESSSTHINAPPAAPSIAGSEQRRQGPMTAYQLMTDQKISLTIIMYALISGLYIQYDEVFSLWAKEPFHTGGLNFSTSDLGIVFSIGGIFLFIYQLFIYPPLESRLGALKTFRWGVLLSVPVFFLLPNVGIIGGWYSPPWGDDDETHGFGDHAGSGKVGWISWGVVVFCQVLRTCLSLQAFTSSFIMTANACPSHSRGSANGVSQAFGAFGRMIGPVLAGNIFSWSVENNLPAPFDFHLLFYLLGLTSAAIYVASLYVPADVDFRLDDDEEEE